MPVLKLYPNGLTGGVPPQLVNHEPVPRGDCEGWTAKSSRSNTRFLYSVVSTELPHAQDGCPLLGMAFSLTVRDCPSSHEDWKSLRLAFVKRLKRRGLYRLHWLTEWQRRGVPHLHSAAWFDMQKVRVWLRKNYPGLPDSAFPAVIKADWLQLTAPYHSLSGAQEIKPISDELGWLKYLSKHAARGAAHYQRAFGAIPVGWQKTGRMWGHMGDFPVREPVELGLDMSGWFAFRRVVRGWRAAQARALGLSRRIVQARRMLQSSDRVLCTVRGVSEWIPLALALDIVAFVARSHGVDS